MKLLIWIYGWPHELLHLLALWLIGRRAVGITRTHIDIPIDLTAAQYVFVAGLPAIVFWGSTLLCARQLFAAEEIGQLVLWALLVIFFSLGGLGTLGDVLLIIERLVQGQPRPPADKS